MTTLAPPSRRCAVCRAFLRSTNPDDVCNPCQRSVAAEPEWPACAWPARVTERILGLLAISERGATLDELDARMPDVARRSVKGALMQLVGHGRAHGSGAPGVRGGGSMRTYYPGPRGTA